MVPGCVPTAMAQLMKFYEWPKQGRGTHTNSSSGVQMVDFSESVYDWDNMLDMYTEGNYTETQSRAVAKLMYDLGVASNLRPSGSGNGAYPEDAWKALGAYFGYDRNMRYISGEYSYPGETLWKEAREGETIVDVTRRVLTEELNAGRPVLLTIWEMWHEDGHEVVCDGYDEEGCFHLNFGWGGQEDGYYNLTGDPMIHNWMDMIIGVVPSKGVQVQHDDLFFEVQDGEACVVACNDGGTQDVVDVTIPETVEVDGNTYPVTEMWRGAFYGQKLNTLHTGNVREIPRDAFMGKYGNNTYQTRLNLKDVTFGPGLQRVCTNAFKENYNLKTVKFEGTGYTLESESFGLVGSNVNNVYGLDGAAEIGDNVFPNIQNISYFTVQPTCKYGIGAVGGTFDYIHLPADLMQFDTNSVTGCAAFEVDSDNPNFSNNDDGLLFNKEKTTLLRCPYWTFVDDMANDNKMQRFTVNVPTTVTKIANHALDGINRVQIPASVLEIEDTTAVSPNELVFLSPTPPTATGPRPYWWKRGALIVPKGSRTAYEQAPVWKDFGDIREEVAIDGPYCFVETYTGSGKLKLLARNAAQPFDGKADIPATAKNEGSECPVTEIDPYAFRSDEQLTALTVPTSVSEIPERSFTGCRNLQKVTLNTDEFIVGPHAFEGCKRLEQVDFQDNNVIVGNGVSTRGYAFNGCTALRSVPGLENAKYITYRSFGDCPLEGDFHFNNLEWGVEGSAFTNTNIESVFLPASCYKVAYDAFSNCKKLHTIEVDAAHTGYFSNDGILYQHGNKGDRLLCCPLMQKRGGTVMERSSVTIPDGIQYIESWAFGNTLKFVTIPASVTEFGYRAFACYPQQVTNLATTPQSIGDHTVFYYGITATLRVPKGCKSLYEQAPGWRQFPTIIEMGDEPTSIEDNNQYTITNNPDAVYDLQGRRLANGSWLLDNGSCKPGVYIVGDKKVVIR